MSLHSYQVSRALSRVDRPFSAYIMAAMRKADPDNLAKLQAAFPEIWAELDARYNAPLGFLDGEGPPNPAWVEAVMAEARSG
jgi:hypothetical protein